MALFNLVNGLKPISIDNKSSVKKKQLSSRQLLFYLYILLKLIDSTLSDTHFPVLQDSFLPLWQSPDFRRRRPGFL